jgi:hypothetical protein
MTKRPSLERILWQSARCRKESLLRTKSLGTWSYACLTLESIPEESYDEAPIVRKNLMTKRPSLERILWRSTRRQKESISCTRLLRTRLDDSISCSWIESGWHRLDVNLTQLASDLGQACQKYVCTVHLWAADDTRPHKSRISVAQWGKKPFR